MIQVSRSGGIPLRSNHKHASIPVLPAPTMTKRSRPTALAGMSLGGTQSTPSATEIRRWPHRRHRGLQIGRVDDSGANVDRVVAAGQRAKPAVAQILGHRKIGHLPAGQQVLVHHLFEVGADLADGGQLVKPFVPAELVDAVAAQSAGVDAVVGRRLMQADERIRAVPMTARRMPAVDDHHLRVGLGHQRVGERHPHRAGADDQIVRVDRCHASSSPVWRTCLGQRQFREDLSGRLR